MLPPFRLGIPLLAALLAAGPADAGWLCVKNETKFTLVIQEVPGRPGQKRGKAIKLLPGEVHREYQSAAGEKKIQVFDSRRPTKPLWSGKLSWSAKGDGTIKAEPHGEALRLTAVVPEKAADVVRVSAPSG